MKKTLVVYYSLSGFTKKVAEIIAKKADADLLELHPSKEIKNGFMKYFWGGKQVMMKETPELKKYHVDVDAYQTIYLGTPVWAYTFTPALRSFFKQTSIKGKNIILFCTHEGGPGKTLENMQAELPGNTIALSKDFNRKLLGKDEEKLEREIAVIA